MGNIYVRDSFDLLDGQLLAPQRFNDYYDEVDEDYEGETFLQERYHRTVYISGGIMHRAYGGPEEGGWWYDHFDPWVEFCLTVNDEATLRKAIEHVDAMLRLRHDDDDVRDLEIILRADHFFQQHRPRYE